MLRDELRRLFRFEERHRRLLARLLLAFALEAWAIFVVTAVAGSFASFFRSGDA